MCISIVGFTTCVVDGRPTQPTRNKKIAIENCRKVFIALSNKDLKPFTSPFYQSIYKVQVN